MKEKLILKKLSQFLKIKNFKKKKDLLMAQQIAKMAQLGGRLIL